MEAMKIVCYKNWSINIDCQNYEHEARADTFAAIAVVKYLGRKPS